MVSCHPRKLDIFLLVCCGASHGVIASPNPRWPFRQWFCWPIRSYILPVVDVLVSAFQEGLSHYNMRAIQMQAFKSGFCLTKLDR